MSRRESTGSPTRLRISRGALLSLERANLEEVETSVDLMAEILHNPQPDGRTKLRADHYPNRPGVIETTNEDWYVAYAINEDGSITISRLHLQKDLYKP